MLLFYKYNIMRLERGMHFGAEVQRFRRAAGLTQQEFAEQTGVSLAFVTALERGARRGVSLEVAYRMSQVLGVPVDRLAYIADAARRDREAQQKQ
jgi:transcriptional regulator with XRE-family HTH domain